MQTRHRFGYSFLVCDESSEVYPKTDVVLFSSKFFMRPISTDLPEVELDGCGDEPDRRRGWV